MKKIFLIFSIISLFAFALHKYHLSLTKVVFNNKSKNIQITMRCFIDDVETSINKIYKIKSELNTNREYKNIDSLIGNYLSENFKININSNELNLNFIGKEYEKDIMFIYLESDSIKQIKKIQIQNKILLANFDDQQNVVKLKINNQKKTFYLKNGSDKEMLKLE